MPFLLLTIPPLEPWHTGGQLLDIIKSYLEEVPPAHAEKEQKMVMAGWYAVQKGTRDVEARTHVMLWCGGMPCKKGKKDDEARTHGMLWWGGRAVRMLVCSW